ncbi:large conductance mechanosensitive channel [Cytobacillus horneckiae]|uniref:Large-conductance mechanosensitive channel n=1 Tax=Cytobacillus horneckiae TaxID=549687 RepID=A0A2N0ZK87_9BACI|nr:large conductance mechanosensitive channel protein MscL [Cytobacillus horneckiae]NRG46614.1 large conductance mechanosensitive channel protein MscL [Bacillus sp. CRN 9]MBN6888165.1 large conductance mechanosensitive channel protein MscL [Cytobacillus horneckiae]MCM3177019.1 large conductance mechanosensitive channel protein MscL [Cytobacillus horneckiae]MEC1154719.1 large conductance mechanosensitive channel protein MscL [Cytobacillus horneckiae]MED2940212.1 large conductance mechanosensiti
MLKEFKEFALRGNVLDLAIGVIIGAAFGSIVTSLVDDIMMPFIGILMGGVDFTSLSFDVGSATIKYGQFIQTVFDFLIVAFSIFLFIRFLNKRLRRKEVEEEKAPEVDAKEELLTEIRDLLKKQNNSEHKEGNRSLE